jgi:hypothetical protein
VQSVCQTNAEAYRSAVTRPIDSRDIHIHLKCLRLLAPAGCCARAASGHTAAAPPSVAKNFRRRIWLAIVTLRLGVIHAMGDDTTLQSCGLCLLQARPERPRRRPAEQRDERASFHGAHPKAKGHELSIAGRAPVHRSKSGALKFRRCSDVRCTTALAPKAEVRARSCCVATVPGSDICSAAGS